jgi:hypothetical protein
MDRKKKTRRSGSKNGGKEERGFYWTLHATVLLEMPASAGGFV